MDAGQRVEVKIDAFPFTRHGTVPGAIVTVSQDAVAQEKVGLVYAIRVVLSRTTIAVGEKVVYLSPGMTMAVDIKTGKRRLIEYSLSPLLRCQEGNGPRTLAV